MKTLLIIGFVWPEPCSSAAGTRMIQLIHLFLNQGYAVHMASAAKKTPYSFDLPSLSVKEHEIQLNNSSFDLFVQKLKPDIVLYDRFMVEEQYSWRVRKNCAHTLHVLDTEDLHFLRYARQKLKTKDVSIEELASFPITEREMAAILRSDLSLIISQYEMGLLINIFKISDHILHYLPFLEKPLHIGDIEKTLTYKERHHFVFIGNFIHGPNWQAVRTLKEKVWPEIRSYFQHAELHIYGAYAGEKVLQLNNPAQGFLVKGRAADALTTLEKYRVLLAPLTFGAGIKGKLLDATKAGTPYLTTPLGSEGIGSTQSTTDIESFADKALEIYQDESKWKESQEKNRKVFSEKFDKTKFEEPFQQKIKKIVDEIHSHRAKNFMGKILLNNNYQSRKYMSLWIEEKNKK